MRNYKIYDWVKFSDGKERFVYKDNGNTITVYDTNDWNDVVDSECYNMPMSFTTYNKSDVVKHVEYKLVWKKG